MSGPLTVGQASRRFVLLTALRWLPVGITIPVSVLLARAKGLSLAEIGLVFTLHSLVVVLLELPTGGLSDAVGHRPVLVLSGLLNLGSALAFATADGVPGFALAALLLGVGRALDSGPLEAWYVDAVHVADARADVTPGLSAAGIADGLALALGAVAGGLLPGLLGGASDRVLVLPFLAAAVLVLLSTMAVVLLVTPTGPVRSGSVAAALRAGLRAVPDTVAGALRLSARDRTLRLLLGLSLVWGVALAGSELLGPLLFADLAGSRTGGSAAFGVAVAVAFGCAAVGSALTGTVRRLAGGSSRVALAGLAGLSATALAALAVAPGLLAAGTAYAVFYLAGGAAFPLRHALLHGRVEAGQRATVLSAASLALQLGGAGATLTVPLVARALGEDLAFLPVAALVLISALVYLRLPRSGDQEALLDEPLDHGQHLLGGLGVGEANAAGEHGQQLAEPVLPVAPREQRRTVDVDPA